ncbi:MAG: hypothetical protein LC800_16555 [Acidobacteria bacterium]|nr:hypothetical protein [Acidobacteriota bacterium]
MRRDRTPRRPAEPRPPGADDLRAGDLLSWDEVRRTHRIRNGVYQRDGRLVSLLTDFGLINTRAARGGRERPRRPAFQQARHGPLAVHRPLARHLRPPRVRPRREPDALAFHAHTK